MKTVCPQGRVGSNPTPCARKKHLQLQVLFCYIRLSASDIASGCDIRFDGANIVYMYRINCFIMEPFLYIDKRLLLCYYL